MMIVEHTIWDATGREIGYTQLTPLEQFKLFKIDGFDEMGEIAQTHLILATAVRTIAGQELAFPTDEDDIEDRMDLLGNHGIDAVYKYLTAMIQANPD